MISSATVVEIQKIFYVIISLRMPFGEIPCPSVFSSLSDTITDLINKLLEYLNWDQNTMFSPKIEDIPDTTPLNDEIPFN